MKKIVWIILGVVVAIALAGGSFYGGMAYQRSQLANARSAFANFRNGTPGANGAGRFGGGGGGINGQIKSIEGNTITLSTAFNTVTVNINDSTTIEKGVAGALSDLKPGDRILVTGQGSQNGQTTQNGQSEQNGSNTTITATQIMILTQAQ
jgi:hypothetical protein